MLAASLFGLAPCGVLPATDLTAGAVRSYRTFSPLLAFALRASAKQASWACRAGEREAREGGRYLFCATFLQVALTGRYPAHCPTEFGLSSRLRPPPFGLQASARHGAAGREACFAVARRAKASKGEKVR